MTDERTAAIFDEIVRWSGIAPVRQDGDFTVAEFAAHIGRSEMSARRALMKLVDAGNLGMETRYDPIKNRVVTVWWKLQGGTPIG